ncbi:uncharacterized protein LOC119175439 isoform X2 [Rhipicephalus microplus]|uniref:uncharacterized protein LOC119175439 isoform X2 n=1 Tax=Rhipicephalus microplus TaxID=6941 RepID=UPI003F6A9212
MQHVRENKREHLHGKGGHVTCTQRCTHSWTDAARVLFIKGKWPVRSQGRNCCWPTCPPDRRGATNHRARLAQPKQ